MIRFLITLILGFFFGSVLIASQAFSWYRIQEMFHFHSFHMFGLLFSAIGTAALSLFAIRKLGVKSIDKNVINVKPKKMEWKANLIGGTIFGIGWGISGACSAPVFILAGFSWKIGLILLSGALIGTLIFGLIESKIPKV
jgi:uncharacterized membrane protein YedE/YeeE